MYVCVCHATNEGIQWCNIRADSISQQITNSKGHVIHICFCLLVKHHQGSSKLSSVSRGGLHRGLEMCSKITSTHDRLAGWRHNLYKRVPWYNTCTSPLLQGSHQHFRYTSCHPCRTNLMGQLSSTKDATKTNSRSVANRRPAVPRCLWQGSSIVTHVHGKALFCLICPFLIKVISLMFW